MSEISGKDERARLRGLYLENGAQGMSEYELLELFLFYALDSSKVKTVYENLLNYYSNDVAQIFSADTDVLCKVEGMTKNAAVLITLLSDVTHLLRHSKNAGVKRLDGIEDAKEYVKNELEGLSYERFLVITLNDENEIISCNAVAEGTVNCANIELVKIVKCVLRDNASSIIVAHNHPEGKSLPSSADKSFTSGLQDLLDNIGITLKDHLIVGTDGEKSLKEEGFNGCA